MSITFSNGFGMGASGGGTNPYGVGTWKLNMSIAESNTTGIAFAAIPFSFINSPGYAVGWTPVTDVQNGGATYWQYAYLSYKEFTTPQTNLAVEGDTSFDAFDDDSRGITIIGDALVGDTSSPTLQNYDGFQESETYNSQFSYTAAANTVIVIASGVESGGDTGVPRNITSITGLGLTWSRRKKYLDPNSNCGQQAEIWYAVNNSNSQVNGVITIIYDNDFDDQIAIVSSWEGCNLSSPWTSSNPSTSNSNVAAPGPVSPTPTPTLTPTPTPSGVPLSQFSPNGTNGPNGLITWLDYTTGINASNNLIDQSPFSNDFSYTGANPYTSGVTGYTFTGGGSYASALSVAQYNQIVNSFTIEMWVKIPSIPSDMSLLAAGGNSSGGWALRIDNSGAALNFVKYNVSDQTVYLNSQIQNNTWYHIAVAQGGTSLTYMVNGVIVGASNSGANNNLSIPNGTVNISKDFYTNSNVALVLGSLKVYDNCRSSADILSAFEESKTGYGFIGTTPTPTPSATIDATPTMTPSMTPTMTPTLTMTPSLTPTMTMTPTTSSLSASAPMTVTIYESGSNVVMSASGTVNLSGLTLVSSSFGPFGNGGLGISNATFMCGANGLSGTSYSGFTSTPANFGTGTGLANSSGTGKSFGVIINEQLPYLLIVPTGYTSGANISSTQTFNNTSLSTLGLTNGTYTYTWSGGSIDVVVGGPAPTPTPSPSTGSVSAGWNFYRASGSNVTMPALSDGQALFYTNVGGPPISTYNPNNGVAQYVMLNKKNNAGTDYTTQFTNLQTNGGTINVTQNGNTATYVGGSGAFFLDPQGFFIIPTALQTVTVASPFTFTDRITITIS